MKRFLCFELAGGVRCNYMDALGVLVLKERRKLSVNLVFGGLRLFVEAKWGD